MNIECKTFFSMEEPIPEESSDILDLPTGKATDTIGLNTFPSLAEWKQKVAVSEMVLYEEPEIVRIEGGIWQMTTRSYRARQLCRFPSAEHPVQRQCKHIATRKKTPLNIMLFFRRFPKVCPNLPNLLSGYRCEAS